MLFDTYELQYICLQGNTDLVYVQSKSSHAVAISEIYFDAV